jgi:hypothetical protein
VGGDRELVRGQVTVAVEHQADGLVLTVVQGVRVAPDLSRAEHEPAAVLLVEDRAHGAVGPGLEPFGEELAAFPGQVVAVGVVAELLQLHR